MEGRAIVAAFLLMSCSQPEARVEGDKPPQTSGQAATMSGPEQLPCAVDTILREKCHACHGRPTRETAPMSLITWQDLHAPAPEHKERPAPVYERIAERIHDTRSPMPPRDRPQLEEKELSTLDIWLSAGAPSGAPCRAGGSAATPERDADSTDTQAPQAPPASGSQGAAGNASPTSSMTGTGATTPSTGRAGAGTSGSSPAAMNEARDAGSADARVDAGPANEDQPVIPSDSDCDYFDLLARNDSTGAPYQVPADVMDQNRCFVFDQKFSGPTQALAFIPVLDNETVVHHWILYSLDAYEVRDVFASCESFNQAGYKMLAGGGAGTEGWYLPKDVGMDLGRGLFMLEVHYNNIAKPAALDQSGVRICAAKAPRPKTATISWLGVDLFSIPPKVTDHTVANRCRPRSQEPIHLLRYWPHMHQLGFQASLRVDHADGTSESLHDAPYTFESQKAYDLQYVVRPGDSFLATCYYNNPHDYPVGLGLKTTDEMCNHFVVAYPASAFTNNGLSAWTDACVGAP